ncbi:MAG TPA: thiamine pyrophosphate-dependent dehydrogenase E1 component subunit alpha [Pirellulales bacterium]|jgi:pyruvate dehydrogenase E1 component alpha subunit|nr:thiamine pyrophosphate-dependent dehydrogenase E1 component subunit alpha [Pirellulales bacterium]
MLRIRLVEEGIAERYAEQQMRCPVHLCIGQEAVAAGVCDLLSSDDQVMSTHRAHGHYLAKGGNLPAMLAEMYGKATGCSGGMGGSMHLVDLEAGFLGAAPIVGSTIPIAVGVAFGSVLRGQNRVVTAFFGEAATEEGAFHEALNFAALKRLPVLFVCENNLYSVYSPLSVRQPTGREVFRLAAGHRIESRQGNGNDVAEVYAMTQEALGQVRSGAGPFFLEFGTYRWREHCGPNYDNHIGYRTEEEFQRWKVLCPVERVRRRGLKEGWLSDADVKRWSDEIQAELAAAVQFAKSSPLPDPRAMFDAVYAERKQPASAKRHAA